jgi:hypothetical protein
MKRYGTDLVVLAGFAATSYGFWLAWHPLGFMLGGLGLAGLGILHERGAAASAMGRRS